MKSKETFSDHAPVKALKSGKIFYFGAGPAALPMEVKQRVRDELLDYQGTGISILELGHRSDEFLQIVAASSSRLRSLLSVPDEYQVLFLPAGARAQFSMIPLNLANHSESSDYILTGYWSSQAAKEGGRYCKVNIAASSEADNFNSIPPLPEWQLDKQAAYVYMTSNETIKGVEFHDVPDTVDRPLVSDMTSNILSRPIDVSRHGLIFAGTQKNLGTAGLCVVILHRELLGKSRSETPSLFNYALQNEADSLMNTPPVVTWYITNLVLEWVEHHGGVETMSGMHNERSQRLYAAIDASGLFFNSVKSDCRSTVNVSFDIREKSLRNTFLSDANNAGLLALEGHRFAGGFRASLYNAMPTAGVNALIEFIQTFERRYG